VRIAECDAVASQDARFRRGFVGIESAGGRLMEPVGYGRYGQDIRDRSFRFACRIVEFCKHLEGGVARILAPQVLRCGTSVGADLEEARGGESRRDFLSKMFVSLCQL
jgi:23S rRNA-intervening sequence protein